VVPAVESESAEPTAADKRPFLYASRLTEGAAPTLSALQGTKHSTLVRYLERGFLVSLDRVFKHGGREYWRTMSNGFVPAHALYPLTGSAFQGSEVQAEQATAWAFAIRSGAYGYHLDDRGRLRRSEALPHRSAWPVLAEQQLKGKTYYQIRQDLWSDARDMRRVDVVTPPAGLGQDEKWIDVDLGRQTLVAYQGPKPVYLTLISSGLVRKPDDPLLDHATPAGDFRITSKHVTHTMDGDHAVDGPYSIEDVPYVMYFQLANALHSAFWHNRFGHPKSHGCLNMAPKDAKWLFNWTEPRLPEGWHAVYPSVKTPGTRVIIHGETARR